MFQFFVTMKQVIFLSIVFSILSFFIINEQVLAAGEETGSSNGGQPKPKEEKKAIDMHRLSPTDPRMIPQKYCDSKCTPSLRPPPDSSIDVKKDSESFYKAMRGMGTDEKSIINILTKRGIIQRMKITAIYEQSAYGKRLQFRLRDELDGAFKASILAIVTPLPTYLGKELHDAITPVGTDSLTMVEILCTISNFGIKSIAELYSEWLHFGSLEAAVKSDTSGSFQKVMVALIQGKRSEKSTVDRKTVVEDAKALNKPGPKNWKADTSEFNKIFATTRSYPHLREVFIEYKKLSGHEIEVDIKKEFPGPAGEGLLAVVKCIKSKSKFLAERLHDSIKGKVQDRLLIRILVSRSEIDLNDIKTAYQELYKESLQTKVASKIGGDYRRTLTNLITGITQP